MYYRFTKPFKRFHGNLNDHQRKIFNIIVVCLFILILGGLLLFFTKDTASSQEKNTLKLTCRDSDGYNIQTKGAVTYTDAAGKHVNEDYCASDGATYEMTCHKPSFWSFSSVPEKKTVTCPNGCINGACTK